MFKSCSLAKEICLYIVGVLEFSGGFRSFHFAIEARSMKALNVQIYFLSFFKSDTNISLCKLNVQVPRESFLILSSFWCFSSIILSAIATVKEVKTEMCFKPSIGLSHPIYETATSDTWSLKRLEMRVFKNQMFFLSRKWEHSLIYSGCQAVEWLQ